MKLELTIKLDNEKIITLSEEEAKELHEKLDTLFGKSTIVIKDYVPVQINPILTYPTTPYPVYPWVTYDSNTGKAGE